MAALEREVTKELSIRLGAEQQEKLERAALAHGQSLSDLAVAALLRAADDP